MQYFCEICGELKNGKKNKKLNKYTNQMLCHKCTCKILTNRPEYIEKMKNIINKKYANNEMGLAIKKSKEKRIYYNKYVHPKKVKNYTKEKKNDVANKKRKTFYSKSKKERKKINTKRTLYWQQLNWERHFEKVKYLKALNFDELLKMRLYEYITGDNWDKIRKKILKLNNYKCQRCGKRKLLDIHHTIPFYLRPKNIELVALCRSCHIKIEFKFRKNFLQTKNIIIAQQYSLGDIKWLL